MLYKIHSVITNFHVFKGMNLLGIELVYLFFFFFVLEQKNCFYPRLFLRWENGIGDFGQHSLGTGTSSTREFKVISSLSKYKIAHQTEDRKLLACGSNSCCKILLIRNPRYECIYVPVETTITKAFTKTIFEHFCPLMNINRGATQANASLVEKKPKSQSTTEAEN